MSNPKLSEIRARQAERFGGTGTTVTNCVQHMNLPCESRPFECKLCQTDTRNDLSRAVAINEWLNEQIDNARTDIPYLLDLVKRMGKLAELILAETNPVNVLGPPIVTHEMERKARELLKEIEK